MTLPSLATLVSVCIAFGLLLALTRRPWTAAALTLYAVGFALLSSYVKQAYLGAAMTLADMHFFLLRPLENFHLFVNYPALGVTLIGLLLLAAVIAVLGMRLEHPIRLLSPPRGRRWRGLLAGTALVLAVCGSLLSSNPSQARGDDGDAYAAFLAMYKQQHPGGWLSRLNVFFDNRSFAATLPPVRKQTRFAAGAPAATNMRPDIFLVLEESTFDPRLLRGCADEWCDFELLHPPVGAVRTRQGPLAVHTTGGGTWLAEFAALSGFDWRAFGRGGAYAPVSLAPRLRQSLPRHLRSLGYRTVAIYPTEGFFLSARSAYEHYGFDEFYDAHDLQLPDDWQAVFDRMVFERALQLAQKSADPRPLFLWVLTIRNHGPHGDGKVPIPAGLRVAEQTLSTPLADYLHRMRSSSQDYAAVARRWLAEPRPRIAAWFGDHQPEAAWDFTGDARRLNTTRLPSNMTGEGLKYLTYFQLSANFGDAALQELPTVTDLAFLDAQLLAFSGLPLDPGNQAALTVQADCQGLLLDCPDRALAADYLSWRIHELQSLR
jgi:hypothetical protein